MQDLTPSIAYFYVRIFMRINRTRLAFLYISVLCYAVSLAVPAINVGGKSQPGWGLLFFGWLDVFALEFRWFANCVFFISLVVAWRALSKNSYSTTAIRLSFAGLIMTSSCLILPIRMIGGDEAALSISFASLDIGAYLWITSFLFMFLSTLDPNRSFKWDA